MYYVSIHLLELWAWKHQNQGLFSTSIPKPLFVLLGSMSPSCSNPPEKAVRKLEHKPEDVVFNL